MEKEPPRPSHSSATLFFLYFYYTAKLFCIEYVDKHGNYQSSIELCIHVLVCVCVCVCVYVSVCVRECVGAWVRACLRMCTRACARRQLRGCR